MNRTFIYSLAVAAALSLGGCGGGGTGPDPDPGGGGGGGGGTGRIIVADPSFANVIQEIFTRRGCSASSCHGSALEAGMDLRPGSAYGNLVNVTATQVSVARVIPGNANDSYIVVKVEGRQFAGERMPLGGSALDNIDLTNLKNWINLGAKNN